MSKPIKVDPLLKKAIWHSHKTSELVDVDDTGKATGKVLKYNEVSGKWEVGDDNNTTYTSSDFDIEDLTDSTSLRTAWSAKMDNPITTAGDIIYGGVGGLPARLGIGTDDQVLTLANGVPTWADASGGGGVSEFECTVNGDGSGDYTTLGDAITDGKLRILVTGNTTETADITASLDNVLIAGTGRTAVAVGMGAYRFNGTLTGCMIRDIRFSISHTSGSLFNGGITYTMFRNLRIVSSAVTGNSWVFGNVAISRSVVSRLEISSNRVGLIYNSSVQTHYNARFEFCEFSASAFPTNTYPIDIFLDDRATGARPTVVFENCAFTGGHKLIRYQSRATTLTSNNGGALFSMCSLVYNASGGSVIQFDGNACTFFRCYIRNAYNNSSATMIGIRAANDGMLLFQDCYFESEFNGFHNMFGNTWTGNACVNFDNCQNNKFILSANTGTISSEPVVHISNPRPLNVGAYQGSESTRDRQVSYVRNKSGGSITEGMVVVPLYSSSTISEQVAYTTTTTEGANVLGVVARTKADAEIAPLTTKGYIYRCRVDGTTDIAAGDLLCTSTTAGISKKWTGTGKAYAIALEGYTTDDTNGIIRAWLFGYMV